MRRSISIAVIALLGAIAASPAAAQKAQKAPVPSGPLRAYKGPEGEVIAMAVARRIDRSS